MVMRRSGPRRAEFRQNRTFANDGVTPVCLAALVTAIGDVPMWRCGDVAICLCLVPVWHIVWGGVVCHIVCADRDRQLRVYPSLASL